jgi:hypothetical protein
VSFCPGSLSLDSSERSGICAAYQSFFSSFTFPTFGLPYCKIFSLLLKTAVGFFTGRSRRGGRGADGAAHSFSASGRKSAAALLRKRIKEMVLLLPSFEATQP